MPFSLWGRFGGEDEHGRKKWERETEQEEQEQWWAVTCDWCEAR